MSKQTQYQKPSFETEAEAIRIARATQRPQQTKEQTKLIAQGIQKGIDQYKKQQKAKAREQNKLRKKQQKTVEESDSQEMVETKSLLQNPWIPWALLFFTWLAIAIYAVF